MKSFYSFIFFIFCGVLTYGQATSIYGKVTTEDTGEELLYANIVLNKNGAFVAGGSTDFDGNYSIPVDPGVYEMKISYTGYSDTTISKATLKEGQKTHLNIILNPPSLSNDIIVTGYRVPLIESPNFGTLTPEQIRNLPTKSSPNLQATRNKLIKKIERQGSSIYGKVTAEKTGEELIDANIVINKKGILVTGGSSDFEGNYSIPVDPGTYDMKVSYTGYPEHEITDIIVVGGQGNKQDISVKQGIDIIEVVGCLRFWTVPLIDQENTSSGNTIISDQIRQEPNKEINELLLSTPGVSIDNF